MTDEITVQEYETLMQAKNANPYWFQAMMEAAGIMPMRRQNYSGELGDPHLNFKAAAMILNIRPDWNFTAQDIALIYQVMKLARVLASGNNEYEGQADGIRDLANYAFLWRGITIQGSPEEIDRKQLEMLYAE